MMIEHCSVCGRVRQPKLSGHLDRKCRKCGSYFPIEIGGPRPSIKEQFSGTCPFLSGTSLKTIITCLNPGRYT